MRREIAQKRRDYVRTSLRRADVDRDPFEQFGAWFREADEVLDQANAMTLSTCDSLGQPSARIVLLKDFDDRGFVFFTNYESSKGRELSENPKAALLFYWEALERQVRIEGVVSRVSPEESDEYFSSRPFGSRIGAIVSQQSRPLENRDLLDNLVRELAVQYSESDVPRPEYWGGYRLAPSRFEFWQGRPNRLHDRIEYRQTYVVGDWTIRRLAP